MAKSEFTLKLQNVVVSGTFEQKVPLEKLATLMDNVEYTPEQFPGAVLRLLDPKLSVLIFSSGSIVITGLKSPSEVPSAVERIRKELKKANINLTKPAKTQVQNMVASVNVDVKLNLDELAFELENAEYNPEQFPGLVYKPESKTSKISFLLFTTGNFVAVGAKSKKEMIVAIEALIEKLKKIKTAAVFGKGTPAKKEEKKKAPVKK